MRVAAIGPYRFSQVSCVTGDATQMRETVKAMRKLPEVEVRCYYYRNAAVLVTETGEEISWAELPSLCDVGHVFTTLPKWYRAVDGVLAKMPTLYSTVYWNNCFREYISVKNGTVFRHIFRSLEYIFRRLVGLKSRKIASWCIGILPNSWAEGDVFRSVHTLRQHAICVPVPNAVAPPPEPVQLARPDDVPKGDYIVCPGIFAPRKNQLALVRAMKGSGLPIVFLGKEYEPVPSHYKKCVAEADENMYFLGHVPSNSSRYWAILKHARVAVLASDCETPGIAMLEAALAGARPVVTKYGGTQEYYGIVAEYLNPYSVSHIRQAVDTAWQRGRLLPQEAALFSRFTWEWAAELTVRAYRQAIEIFNRYHASTK